MNNLFSSLQFLPQEQENTYQFNSPLYVTRGFITSFGDEAQSLAIHSLNLVLNDIVKVQGGADYLQIFVYNGKRFFMIDDVDHITVLLPEEY